MSNRWRRCPTPLLHNCITGAAIYTTSFSDYDLSVDTRGHSVRHTKRICGDFYLYAHWWVNDVKTDEDFFPEIFKRFYIVKFASAVFAFCKVL